MEIKERYLVSRLQCLCVPQFNGSWGGNINLQISVALNRSSIMGSAVLMRQGTVLINGKQGKVVLIKFE